VKVLTVLALLAVFIILCGCTSGPAPAPQQPNATANASGPGSITLIVGTQTNQTINGNTTISPAPEANQTEPVYENDTNATLGVYFIDVGSEGLHGSSILVKKGDMDVLIDAGPAQNVGNVVDLLDSLGVTDIDLLISTNADPRNYGGISTIASDFNVEDFWWNGETFNDSTYTSLVQGMANNPHGSQIVEQGNSTTLNGVTFDVISPSNTKFEDVNNDAIVLRVTDRNFSMLLTSNIESGAEGTLLSNQPGEIQTQVMQAPYYGVGAGTGGVFPAFLSKANPETVIITGSADESGDNGGSRDPFRALMREQNITWYETYVSGTLRITSDGTAYVVQNADGSAATPGS
jgi:beta-lactamase superfamily II metal-dependent hydrolase